METTNKLVAQFMDEIWNQQLFERLPQFLHPDFKDHSLPPGVPGVQAWISSLSQSFTHHTIIEEQVTEGYKSILKLRLSLVHIGTWRDIPATGASVSTVGYRTFRVADGRIIEHWALMDGNAIETQLKQITK
jgi:predicted ester cyclase